MQTTTQATTVMIADDHGIVRTGLRLLFERIPGIQVTGEATDGRQAVALAKQLRPDIVIMDVGMPLLNGLEATAQIMKDNPSAGVIMLSMHADESYVLKALDAGAKGYLLKDKADDDIEEAVRAVSAGKPYFSPAGGSCPGDARTQRAGFLCVAHRTRARGVAAVGGGQFQQGVRRRAET
jgi:DNA-binding NarL/FixJ family response regulator